MAVQKNGDILINEWEQGIGESPHTGFAMMRNVEIHKPKGVLKIAPAPTKISSTTVTDLITWFAVDADVSTDIYAGGYLDSKVYKIDNTSAVTSVSGVSSRNKPGGIIWKDYLIVATIDGNNDEIELDAFDLNTTWTADFASTGANSVRASSFHIPMFAHPSESDSLYLGADNNIAKLAEDTTFDPTSGATFTFTASALDLPPDYSAESLAQSASDLLIGASKVGGSHFQHNNFAGQIFPWDRTSASFDNPVSLDSGSVRQLINRNNTVYYTNGEKGDYYVTNVSIFEQLPTIAPFNDLANDKVGLFFDEAKEIFDGELLFGVSRDETSFAPAGVYGYKDGAWRFLEISTGSIGETNELYIGAIVKSEDDDGTFFVSWRDNTTYGIDEFGQNGYRYTGYKAYVDSPLYTVGDARNKKNYKYLDINLAKELATGEGVRIKYRKNLTDDFTTIGTLDFATYGAVDSYTLPAKILETVNVQIRVELTTGSSSTTTPELKSLTLR